MLEIWVRSLGWRRAWPPTPGFLPGESHGQRSLVGYSPWGRKESDTTELLSVPSTARVSFSLLKWNASLAFLFSEWFIFMLSPGRFLASRIHQISLSVIRLRINGLALGLWCCLGTTLEPLCVAFSLQWLLELALLVVWPTGLVALQRRVESSWPGGQTCLPCIGRWTLIHCTTGEVQAEHSNNNIPRWCWVLTVTSHLESYNSGEMLISMVWFRVATRSLHEEGLTPLGDNVRVWSWFFCSQTMF